MKKIFLIISFSLIIVQTNYAQHEKGGNYSDTIIIDNLKRTYYLHLPIGYSFIKTKALPLVIVLHGAGGRGKSISFESKFNTKANKEKFIVVYPNGYEKSWNDARKGSKSSLAGINDIKFISELIKKLESDYNIDSRRIYIAGVSNGGFMAQTLACKMPEKFAAIASVIASFPKKLAPECQAENQASIMYILGTADPFIPYTGGTVNSKAGGEILSAEGSINFWADINNCNTNVEIIELPDLSPDDVTVTKIIYKKCSDLKEVVLYKLNNGGHQYPQGFTLPTAGNKCNDINATDEIWNFFKKHSIK